MFISLSCRLAKTKLQKISSLLVAATTTRQFSINNDIDIEEELTSEQRRANFLIETEDV